MYAGNSVCTSGNAACTSGDSVCTHRNPACTDEYLSVRAEIPSADIAEISIHTGLPNVRMEPADVRMNTFSIDLFYNKKLEMKNVLIRLFPRQALGTFSFGLQKRI